VVHFLGSNRVCRNTLSFQLGTWFVLAPGSLFPVLDYRLGEGLSVMSPSSYIPHTHRPSFSRQWPMLDSSSTRDETLLPEMEMPQMPSIAIEAGRGAAQMKATKAAPSPGLVILSLRELMLDSTTIDRPDGTD